MKIEKIGVILFAGLVATNVAAQKDGERSEGNDRQRIEKLFMLMDNDGDGVVTLEEFMASSNNEDAAEKEFIKIDGNKDGKVDKLEFSNYEFEKVKGGKNKGEASPEDRFRILDINRDRSLTADEFMSSGASESVALTQIKDMDQDGDEKITFGEFSIYDRLQNERNKPKELTHAERFRIYDVDTSGSFSFDEIYKVGLDKELPFEKFEVFDMNMDGQVDLQEYENTFMRREGMRHRTIRYPKESFERLDQDKDGYLNQKELNEKIDDEKTNLENFKKKDSNGDNKVSLEEYTLWATKELEADKRKELELKKQQENPVLR